MMSEAWLIALLNTFCLGWGCWGSGNVCIAGSGRDGSAMAGISPIGACTRTGLLSTNRLRRGVPGIQSEGPINPGRCGSSGEMLGWELDQLSGPIAPPPSYFLYTANLFLRTIIVGLAVV